MNIKQRILSLIGSAKPDLNPRVVNANELVSQFNAGLDRYRSSIDAKWTLDIRDMDDILSIEDERDGLHEIVLKAQIQNIELSKLPLLVSYDKEWQDWILSRINTDMQNRQPIYLDQNIEREKWWFWIEDLKSLTDEQRKTL